MSSTLTLTDQDKHTLRAGAYGAVSLLAAAGAAGSPHRIATDGSIALASATGPIGHVLAGRSKIKDLNRKSVAELADLVLPALTASVRLLKKQDPAEADNYRDTVLVALEAAARADRGEPGPALAEMLRKITEALDAR
ncbi:hypothetical protein [Streptomyces spectabilis]|uniref:D-alanyl-D-alanine carboxypeptidase n=1 Tax=Streptomyces spectabilis TaxID=68270 RepID=A0A7W8AZG5_STRST|nr:hypothetical protein [Streptomyces spectabilis]MBB5107312.1 hypothetical protein [Streptomyces spectabilis]GGV36805.1 hypothetical protein GCM10010245_58610 [Streptomyces spectabilis]